MGLIYSSNLSDDMVHRQAESTSESDRKAAERLSSDGKILQHESFASKGEQSHQSGHRM